jgi:hypothetical protein
LHDSNLPGISNGDIPDRNLVHMQKITINGKDLVYEGLVHNGEGIRAGGRIFVMYPALGTDAQPIGKLPLVGPYEIRRVTIEVPDLTKDYPETVRRIFEKRRAYYQNVTRVEHLKKYPESDGITRKKFQKAKSQIVAESLDDFTATGRARREVWKHHGTDELAKRSGYLGTSQTALLFHAFKRQGRKDKAAWSRVNRIKCIALYDDPEHTVLFLYDLKEEPDPSVGETIPGPQLLKQLEPISKGVDHISKVVEVLSVNVGGQAAKTKRARARRRGNSETQRVLGAGVRTETLH